MYQFKFLNELVQTDHKRLDETLFRDGDEAYEYEYSPVYVYKMAKSAENFFKRAIIYLESKNNGNIYTTEVTKEVIDEEAEAKLKSQYEKEFMEFETLWKGYRNTHLDEFDERIQVSRMEEFEKYEFNRVGYSFNNLTLSEAAQGYLCAKELIKLFESGEDLRYDLPKVKVLVSKKEFKEKHEQVRDEIRDKIGLPSDDYFKSTKVVKTKRQMKNFKKELKVITDESPLNTFNKAFFENILNKS